MSLKSKSLDFGESATSNFVMRDRKYELKQDLTRIQTSSQSKIEESYVKNTSAIFNSSIEEGEIKSGGFRLIDHAELAEQRRAERIDIAVAAVNLQRRKTIKDKGVQTENLTKPSFTRRLPFIMTET